MLKLRLREYTPGGVKGRVLPIVDNTLEVTTKLNDTPTISFSMSTITAGKMPDDGFIVGVEYAVGNGKYQPLPQHDRFIVTEDNGDDADLSKVINYSGQSYMVWLLAHTYVHWAANAKNNQRTVYGTAGGHMRYFLLESKARGWGTQFNYDFDGNKDSNGVNWVVADDAISIDWNLLTPLSEVLDKVNDGGLCDWTVEGHKLRLFRHNTLGSDKTNLVIGKSVTQAPVKTDMNDVFTNLTVVPEKASYWLYLPNPGAPTKYGRLEATMTQSGIASHAEATKLAQPALLKGRTIVREEAFQTAAKPGDLVPWKDYIVGDKVSVVVRGTKVARRVIGIVARAENGTTSVRTIVGDPISSVTKKILDRVGAASVGNIVGGSGSSFPGTIGPSPLAPDMPDNVRVTSNTGKWLQDGRAESTVKIEWEPVTKAVDGSDIDIREYEVWSRVGGGDLSRDTAVINPEAIITSWEPGVERTVVIRALSTSGQWSDFSLDLLVTPIYPTSIAPKAPDNLVVLSNEGHFTPAGIIATVKLKWDAVTESTDDQPITVSEYELIVDGSPMTRTEGTSITVLLESGSTAEYQVRARTNYGFWGDPSPALSVTGASPEEEVIIPTAPLLVTGYGNVSARWDGEFVSGGETALGVWIEAGIVQEEGEEPPVWIRQGAMLTGEGSVPVLLGSIGETVTVRAVAYDKLNRLSGVSSPAAIVINGIDGDDIQAGTIEGNRIKAGTISVDQLVPNIGDTLNLSANGSIVLMVDRQNTLENTLEHTTQMSEETAEGLAKQQAVFVVTEFGAEVRSRDASNILSMRPSGVSIIQGGVAVSSWDGSRFNTNELITTRAQIGNHVFEKSGNRTVVRPLA